MIVLALQPHMAQAQGSLDDVGVSFRPAVQYAVGSSPYVPAVGDFNADGVPDIVVGNENSDNISVLLGTGSGAFSNAVQLAAGDGAQGVAVADLDGNSTQDVVVANLWNSTVSVFLGTGTGSFAPAAHYGVGANPHAAVIGDFNGDTRLDIATADGGGGVSVILGAGNGLFGAFASFTAGGNPRDLERGDFNGDAKPDLVVTNEGTSSLSVLLGNGAGGFGTATHFAVGAQPQSVSVGDLNGDGKLDLAIPSKSDNLVSILLGLGDGSFTAQANVPLASTGSTAVLVDLSADGKLDLAVASGLVIANGGGVSVFGGSGTGAFGAASGYISTNVFGIAVTDLNGDAKPDLIGASPGSNTIVVAINNSASLVVSPSANAERTSSYFLRKSPLWINRQSSATAYSHAIYADVDQDGDADFIRTFSNNADRYPVQVMINNGNETFSDQTVARIVGSQPGVLVARKLLCGDYNGDHWPDFFLLAHGIDLPPFPGEYPQLFLSNSDGTLRYVPDFESEVGFHHGGASADIDGNGTVDILVGGNPPFFQLNNGDETFSRNTSRLPLRASGPPVLFNAAELTDVDGDGFVDLLLDGDESLGSFNTIYWGGTNGLYRDSRKTVLPAVTGMSATLDFAIEDIDGDGKKDVIANRTCIAAACSGRYLQILRQTVARQFIDETATRISMNQSLRAFDYLRSQDINGDGFVDLFIDDKNDMASGEYAWTNNGAGLFAPYTGVVTPAVPPGSTPWTMIFGNGFEGL